MSEKNEVSSFEFGTQYQDKIIRTMYGNWAPSGSYKAPRKTMGNRLRNGIVSVLEAVIGAIDK